MNLIQSFKALFQEHLDNLISYASIHPCDRDDLVTFQKDLEPVETLSDLCALFKDHNRILPLCMHQAYITELSRMIGEDKLRAHQILINPTSIPDTPESKEYIALYDRPTKTQQKGQYVVYIGPGEPHITGRPGHKNCFLHNQSISARTQDFEVSCPSIPENATVSPC